jgi:hypothetical protein
MDRLTFLTRRPSEGSEVVPIFLGRFSRLGTLRSRQARHVQKSPTVPPPERIAALRHDYLVMRDMDRVEPMEFERILGMLGDLEARMNDEKRA